MDLEQPSMLFMEKVSRAVKKTQAPIPDNDSVTLESTNTVPTDTVCPTGKLKFQHLDVDWQKLPKAKLSENGRTILEKRYLIKDENNKVLEEPEQLFWRVAENIALAEQYYGGSLEEVTQKAKAFYRLMASLDFLPNSPCLRGAGRELQQLSACFVLPIDDDLHSILNTLKNAALIHKTGGGTGFDFSRLRPSGDIITSTGNKTPGPLAFMRLYNSMAEEITQGGVRKGANMGILRCDHPDIEQFIEAKTDGASLTNFNISIAATDKFMAAVKENKDFELINPRTKKTTRKIKAKEVFEKICQNAWKNGDPGMIFIDRINNSDSNPTPSLGQIESTNPCGEQPLLPYESCVLGSINLANHIKTDQKNEIDWEKLQSTVTVAVNFLDNVIDMNKYVVPEIERMTKGLRRIGLGVMGFADLLIDLEIPYNSKEAAATAKKIMKFINTETYNASKELAKKRGAYPFFDKSRDFEAKKLSVRNVARTTIAPTGTISVIADCSSGIEPLFALVYKRKSIWDNKGAQVELDVVDKRFKKTLKEEKLYSDELIAEIAKQNDLSKTNLPAKIKKLYITAHNLTYEDHIAIQAAFQEHTENAVSKTINFPHCATVEDVRNAYLAAYGLNCKGITVYRDGSREMQVLSFGKETKPEGALVTERLPRERPEIVRGFTYRSKTAYGNLYITINEDENSHPFEVFTSMGKAGGFFAAKVEAISRLISLALRSGIPANEIIEQLEGIRGPSPVWDNGQLILSVPDAIAKILKKHLSHDQKKLDLEYKAPKAFIEAPTLSNNSSKQKPVADFSDAPICPECGSMLEVGEGCLTCHVCGFSKCG